MADEAWDGGTAAESAGKPCPVRPGQKNRTQTEKNSHLAFFFFPFHWTDVARYLGMSHKIHVGTLGFLMTQEIWESPWNPENTWPMCAFFGGSWVIKKNVMVFFLVSL